jgi:hypothetical protein
MPLPGSQKWSGAQTTPLQGTLKHPAMQAPSTQVSRAGQVTWEHASTMGTHVALQPAGGGAPSPGAPAVPAFAGPPAPAALLPALPALATPFPALLMFISPLPAFPPLGAASLLPDALPTAKWQPANGVVATTAASNTDMASGTRASPRNRRSGMCAVVLVQVPILLPIRRYFIYSMMWTTFSTHWGTWFPFGDCWFGF